MKTSKEAQNILKCGACRPLLRLWPMHEHYDVRENPGPCHFNRMLTISFEFLRQSKYPYVEIR